MFALRSTQKPKLLPLSKFPLDMKLLNFSAQAADAWTLRDACEGTQIFGATGSGKTSGSGQMIAKAFLRAGFGGLVLCAKPGERDQWVRYANETGRIGSTVVFDESGLHRFNFLNYEMRRGERLVVHNLVNLFLRVGEAAQPSRGGGGDEFWRKAMSEMLSYAFLPLYAAYGRIELADLMRLIDTAAQSGEELKDADWRATSYCFATIKKAYESPAFPLPEPDLRAVNDYWMTRFPRLSDRTRSSIVATLTAIAHPFQTGYLRELFCTYTNIVPEMTHEAGLVIILDLPVKEHSEAGVLAQHIFKYLWQRAAERREVTETTRPLFLWGDESQFFVSEYDLEFQSTARSSKSCTVYMTQNLPTYYAKVGGNKPEHTINALMSNLQTKIFHQNTDKATNEMAADIIGRRWQWTQSHSTSEGESRNRGGGTSWNSGGSSGPQGSSSTYGGGGNRSWGEGESVTTGRSQSEHVEYEVLPSTFTELAKGGRGRAPEAIITQGGRPWKHNRGRFWLRTGFPQG